MTPPRILLALIVLPTLLAAQAPDTAAKVWVAPGERAGTSVFPRVNYPETRPLKWGEMDWQHYHTNDEINFFMRQWAERYPDLVQLYEVGRSYGGVPIWQLTITNRKTGRDTDKPAAFFEGGRHSGEITATESAFYLAWYLVTNYGKDSAVTRLLDRKAIYVKPVVNPDGSEMYRLTAQANRSSVRPHDSDRDGLLDEDPGEDLDGDGYVRDMRKYVGPGKGNAVKDTADRTGRLMRNVGGTTRTEWAVWTCTATTRRTGVPSPAAIPPDAAGRSWAPARTHSPSRKRARW
jgi:hypothetical protein